MPSATKPSASSLLVIMAFATVYLVWGSTYFFIRMAEQGGLPPFLLGAIRFFTAGILLMAWCVIKGEKIFIWRNVANAAVVGILLLLIGNGIVIWSEQTLPSAMVAIMVSSAPIWFVLIDAPNWGVNLRNKSTVIGLIIGFAGVLLLFSDQIESIFSGGAVHSKLPWMLLLMFGSMAWAAGSIYSKYRLTGGSGSVNTAWQMIVAGIAFIPGSVLRHETVGLHWHGITANAWVGLGYLIFFGSIAAYSAYVWLLQIRPATQVSTYAYVNPVIAVILGVFIAHENISFVQIAGLAVILGSVLLINLSKYKKKHPVPKILHTPKPELSGLND